MLKLVLGRAGSGKSSYIMEQALLRAKAGGAVAVVVPEQASFVTQVKLAKAVRGTAAGNIEVLDFSRTAEKIFRVCGGVAGRRLDDMARCVIMRLACDSLSGSLAVYGRQSGTPAFLSAAIAAVEEFKQEGLYPAQLLETANCLSDAPLKAKLTDLARLYEAYQQILERSYCDPLDDLQKANDHARRANFFAGYDVYVDGFARFGAPEMRLLETMLEQAESVTVALTADGLSGGDTGLFSDQQRTARSLCAYARAVGITVEEPLMLTESQRLRSPGLLLAERICSAASYRKEEPLTDDAVTILTAGDKYGELRYVSAEICRLLREENYRYRDIAVLCRSMEDYRAAAETVFGEYNIPVFLDRKESICTRPLAAAALSALEACRGRWKTEAILALSRSPALGISQEAAGELENYCYTWSVRGDDWLRPFANAPDGMTDRPPADYAAETAALEQTRQRIMTPLLALKKTIAACDGKSFCRGLYAYLTEIDATEHLKTFLSDGGDAALDENDRVWEALVDVLDLFCDLIPDAHYSVTAFIELFTLALSCARLGNVPNTRDSLLFGDANRVRPDSPRAVFVLGLNEGEFPAVAAAGGVFTDRERETLSGSGIELGVTGVRRALRERFCLYSALTAPRERLYLCCHAGSLKGEPAKPSAVLRRLSALLPGSVVAGEPAPYFYVASPKTARGVYASLFAAGRGEETATLAALLAQTGDGRYPDELRAAASGIPAAGITPQTAKCLTGERLTLSPTAIETFYQCPYRYFCQRMLRLSPRRRVEYSPLSSGSAIHYVLEKLLERHGGQGLAALSATELAAQTAALLEEFVLTQVADERQLTPKFRYQMRRLNEVLCVIVRHIAQDFAQSEFTVAATETAIGDDGEIAGAAFSAADGTPIRIVGKIDRIDVWKNGEQSYARVVDYKSGNKQFSVADVLYGLNMQMLIYLFTLCDDIGSRFGKQEAAGVLYVPGGPKPGDGDEALEKALRMSGLLLDDEAVLRAMEHDLAGRYIPVTAKPDGGYKKENVMTAEQFGKLREKVYRNISALGDALCAGEIAPLPAKNGAKNDPCRYCEYGALCRDSDGARCRDLSEKGGAENGATMDD